MAAASPDALRSFLIMLTSSIAPTFFSQRERQVLASVMTAMLPRTSTITESVASAMAVAISVGAISAAGRSLTFTSLALLQLIRYLLEHGFLKPVLPDVHCGDPGPCSFASVPSLASFSVIFTAPLSMAYASQNYIFLQRSRSCRRKASLCSSFRDERRIAFLAERKPSGIGVLVFWLIILAMNTYLTAPFYPCRCGRPSSTSPRGPTCALPLCVKLPSWLRVSWPYTHVHTTRDIRVSLTSFSSSPKSPTAPWV